MKKMLFLFLSCFTLAACNQNTSSSQQNTQTQTKAKPIIETTADCLTDTQEILSKIDQKSSIQQLSSANFVLKKCIKTLNHAQLYTLLATTDKMYARFLTTTSGDDSLTGLNAYGYAKFYPENAQDLGYNTAESIKKTLPKRDQYLMDQIGKEYIQFLDIGEGYFDLKRHPLYVADLFASYLPEAEAVFIRRMAQDNSDILYSDAAISIPWQTLVERALFWEKYLEKYPNSRFNQDAKNLFHEYEYLSFMGSDNSDTFGFSNGHYVVESEEVLPALKWLAKQPHSKIAEKARIFLDYTAKNYATIGDQDYDKQHESLIKLLKLTPSNYEIDCHTGALCKKNP
ncbi:hypothetical protein RFI02_18240 [Acinetobacter sichuanensis]|uniref:hypothetical protein n=1 Tax=Acinetobacter sichuanensis TaxID=2136183 RepID=UPI00280FFB26|nr:hypothetical protein [Acinetobacter sichuanensis]MDQ9023045.1 hypothetical protein [Acinetobacter sichuanensis]